MNRIVAWLRSFVTFVYVKNMNVLITDGTGSVRSNIGVARTAQPLLLQPSTAPRPRLAIHMASSRRDRPLERGNEAQIRAGWQATMKRR